MASPVVAGALAITIGVLKSKGQVVDVGHVEDLVEQSARVMSGLSTQIKNGRLLDLAGLARSL